MKRALLLAVILFGCASPPSGYTRVDGTTVDSTHMRAILAQCKAEGAMAVANSVNVPGPIPWIAAQASRPSQELTVINACMARNGYITP